MSSGSDALGNQVRVHLAMHWTACIVALALLVPLSAQAEECAQWDMSGIQIFDQSNGYVVQFRSKQTGSEFHGIVNSFEASGGKGLVDGRIEGDDLQATVVWDGGSVGVYTGRVNLQGYPEGITHDRMHPQSTASWQSRYKLECLATSSPLLPAPSAGTPTPAQSDATPPPPVDPGEKLGVVERPGKGIGQILHETQPAAPLDKKGVLNKP